jgi:capsular polysaccharide export protein
MSQVRRYLFLQGNVSRFFDRLGRALHADGHIVHRINFNGGDRAFWTLPGAVDFRGKPDEWPAFLQARLAEWRITDIILFGDCRPLHRVAISAARPRGICVHVCDEGYLRPNWITVEEGGVNGHSPLHRDLRLFHKAASFLPAWSGGTTVRNSSLRRALEDIWYLVCTMLLGWRFMHYRTHRPHHKLVEYVGGARRLLGKPLARFWLQRDVARIRALGQPHYVFPLQLEADSQIRYHSNFGSITSAIEQVIASFASTAPAGTVLAITEHPLETSLNNWRRIVRRLARSAGVNNRVVFLEGGTPELLLQDCRGVVTVNSTVGYLALTFGRPVVTLGEAIYDMPGLTFQGGLDAFWSRGAAPDAAGLDAFRRVVAAQTQVNGGYFCTHGIELAVDSLLARWRQAAPIAMRRASEIAEPPREAIALASAHSSPTNAIAASGQA